MYGSWSFPSPTGIELSVQLCDKCHYLRAPLPASVLEMGFPSPGRSETHCGNLVVLEPMDVSPALPPEQWGLGVLLFFFLGFHSECSIQRKML